MFTKEIITELFTKRNGQNFIINTNEGVGRGINGIEYNSYAGYREFKDRDSYCNKTIHVVSKIIEVQDSYLVIEYKDEDAWLNGMRDIVIPYDNITSINFIKEPMHGYTITIPKNNLFSKKVKKAV